VRIKVRLLVPVFAVLWGGASCAASSQSQSATTLPTGFWFWKDSSANIGLQGGAVDVLFVHVGTIAQSGFGDWHAYGVLPDRLPAAGEYWIVFRFERQRAPDLAAVPRLAGTVAELLATAKRRGLQLAGVQLDIDCPTAALPKYAGFLKELRRRLPSGVQISITALLDWFRDGTAVGSVIQEVDEFVPQFYDLAVSGAHESGTAIAARFEAAQWAPRFNRFKKRFRVGFSTFGRSRIIRKERGRSRYEYVGYRDLTPLDIAVDPAFALQTTRNEANELILSYQATKRTRIDSNDFNAGDVVQFTLATPETVRDAVESVRRLHGYFAGVVFFRWPTQYETLVLQPAEVLRAAGVADVARQSISIETVDGACAAVNCVDVYLSGADPLSPNPSRYRIRSSVEFEYFLPEERVPIRMAAPDMLELSLPPYGGRGRLYLGRAVTSTLANFSAEQD
jgi:hypothetical protein